MMENDFIDGVLYACQEIYLSHGQDMMACEIMRAAGTKNAFLNAQKRSDYESKKMNAVIRNAFHNVRCTKEAGDDAEK